MARSVLEYLATDKFILTFLTAHTVGQKGVSVQTIYQSMYDTDVLDLYNGDDLGIPYSITCTNPQFNVNDDGILHGNPTSDGANFSFKCDELQISWMIKNSEDISIFDRADGPARIKIRNYEKYHSNGDPKGFSADTWAFNWYKNGNLLRDSGPHSVQGDTIRATITSKKEIKTAHNPIVMCLWSHPRDGKSIPESVIKPLIEQEGIKVNRMSLEQSVFETSFDEMAFYSKVVADTNPVPDF